MKEYCINKTQLLEKKLEKIANKKICKSSYPGVRSSGKDNDHDYDWMEFKKNEGQKKSMISIIPFFCFFTIFFFLLLPLKEHDVSVNFLFHIFEMFLL